MKHNKRIAIVLPVYDDWESFTQLIDEISSATRNLDISLDLVAVDDGSFSTLDGITDRPKVPIASIEILRLVCNVGHQRTIAIGLCEIARRGEFDAVIVMDSDGEDRPEDLVAMINVYQKNQSQIIVGARTKRSENVTFRISYFLYRVLFRLLVGATIDFGNFCLIPDHLLGRIVHTANIWNSLSATIARSKIPFVRVATYRGKRYAGQSKMKLESLILHGLSTISVYADAALVRLLLTLTSIAALGIMGMLAVFCVRFFSDLGIRGWATSTSGILLIIVLQSILSLLGLTFTVLNRRSSDYLIPMLIAPNYIKEREVIYRND